MIAPSEPTGDTIRGHWLKKLLQFCKANQVQPGVGYRVSRTSSGTTLEIDKGGGAMTLGCYKLKSVQRNYLTCHTWSWSADLTTGTEGTTNILIAKPWKLRLRLTAESPYGVAHGYSYHDGPDSDNRLRWDSTDSFATYEIQAVIPAWIVNDIIWAVNVGDSGERDGEPDKNTDGTGKVIPLLMVGESRMWAKIGTGP